MSQWQTYKLSQICQFIDYRGKTPDKEGKGIPFITAKNVKKEGFSFEPREYISLKTYNTIMKRGFPKEGDIFFTTEAPLGNVCKIPPMNGMFAVGQRIIVLQTDSNKISNEYLVYELKSKYFSENLRKCTSGSTVKGVRSAELSKIEVRIPPIAVQKKIAKTLDTAADLLKLRKQQIAELDLLVKSRFVEMFGDPYTNEKGWKIEKLGNLTTKITDGVHAKPNYTTSGKSFISVVNITKGYVDFTNCKYVSEEDYSKMIKSTHPEKDDVLYTKVGATYGIPAYIDTDEDFCLYVSVCLIKPNHEKIDSRFLAISMSMPYVKMQADRRIRGIGVPDLHLNQIREFDIVCPHPEMQRKFVCFVQQVDKLKFDIQKSLDEMNMLFNALMQKYFE